MNQPASHLGPYSNLPLSECGQVVGTVSAEDKRFMKSLDPSMGGINLLLTTIFASIVKECKENGITYYSPDNVRTLHAIIRHRAAARLVSTRPDQNGPTAASPVHSTDQGASDQSPNLRESTPQGVGGGRGGKRKSRKETGKQDGEVSGE